MYNKEEQSNFHLKMKIISLLSFLATTTFLSGCVVNVAPSAQEDTKKSEPEKPIKPTPVKPEEKPVPAPVRGPGNLDAPPYVPPAPPPYIPPVQIGPGNL